MIEDVIWGAATPDGSKLGLGQRTSGEYGQGNSLAKASNLVIEMAIPKLLKIQAMGSDILGSRNELPWSVSSCNGISFARLPTKIDCSAPIALLGSDLLTSATLPPLSLEAAVAVESARLGDFQTAGGEIVEIGLHAVVPRLTKLGENDWGLVRLAPVWPIQPSTALEKQNYLRCDIQPAWVQHRYFYWQLPAGSQLSASP